MRDDKASCVDAEPERLRWPGMTRLAITAVAIIAVALIAVFVFGRQGPGGSQAAGALCDSDPRAIAQATDASVTELKVEDDRAGTGLVAKAGDTVNVHYVGRLLNGKQFDSSCDRGQPFTFPLGGGQVIQGWDRGIAGMKVGGRRRLIIPSSLGYGAQGAGADIPPNAALVFDVELVSIQ